MNSLDIDPHNLATLIADEDDDLSVPIESTPQPRDTSFEIASAFLKMLDSARNSWEFRTFDDVVLPDRSKRKDPKLTTTIRRSLKQAVAELKRMNAHGAGVFVTINRTDGKGRTAENVTDVQAFFADTDGADIQPLLVLKPHIVVESSPGKWHLYWLVNDCELSRFKPIQSAIAEKFGTDKSVCDLPRVMRLPGFLHNKQEPFSSTFAPEFMDPKRKPYTVQEVVEGLNLQLHASKGQATNVLGILDEMPEPLRKFDLEPNTAFNRPPPPAETMRAALQHLANRNYFEHRSGTSEDADGRILEIGWIETGMALKAAYDDEVGLDLWGITHTDERARNDAPGQWASFAPEARAGDVTIGTIIKAAKDAGFPFNLATQLGSAVSPTGDAEQFTGHGADVWNGKKFAEMFRRKLLHIHETGEWLLFSPEQGWVAAPPGEAERAAKEVIRALSDEAAERWKANPADPVVKELLKHVERASVAKNLHSMIDMAKSEPGMTVQLAEFDTDPMLLGVANGVLDLTNGVLLPVSPEVLVSKRCNVVYDPSATCPRFDRFILEVLPDPDVCLFMLRLMGYCLTGRVDEQVFAFLYGHGANGKSVFVEAVAWLLGDYARKIQTEMLMQQQRNSQGPSPDIVSLKGMRFVYANETEEGRHLAESRVKDMTGGDTLTGRVPYGKADITFRPTHKLIVVGNHKPEISDTSFGMWRRVALTPFDQTIPEANRDPKLLETLKGEGSGILNRMLAGLRMLRKSGLQIPAKITAATAAYRDEQDILGDWIGERCNAGTGCSEKKGVLYADYKEWADRNGHKPLAQGRLTRRLVERGFKRAADNRTILGIALTRAGALGLGRNV